MQYKFVFFGNEPDSESKFLNFVDGNWSRVISGGHSSTMDQMETFEKPGWYCRLSKADVAPLTIKAPAKKPA